VTNYTSFNAVLASDTHQPASTMEALYALADESVGARLFTLTTVEPVTGEYARIYSNEPDAYPVFGRKPADISDWSNYVLRDRKSFVANDIATIAARFPDHALIRSLGCESVINVPIEVCGRVVGTINMLHEAGYYTAEKVRASELLKLPGAVCFLLVNQLEGIAGAD